MQWSLFCSIGNTIGAVQVSAQENAARVAEFWMKTIPTIDQPVDLVLMWEGGSRLIFRGRVDEVLPDTRTRLAKIICSDRMQEQLNAVPDYLPPIYPSSWYMVIKDDPSQTNAENLKRWLDITPVAASRTPAGSISYATLTNPVAAAQTYTASSIIDGSVDVRIAAAQELLKTKKLRLQMRSSEYEEVTFQIHWDVESNFASGYGRYWETTGEGNYELAYRLAQMQSGALLDALKGQSVRKVQVTCGYPYEQRMAPGYWQLFYDQLTTATFRYSYTPEEMALNPGFRPDLGWTISGTPPTTGISKLRMKTFTADCYFRFVSTTTYDTEITFNFGAAAGAETEEDDAHDFTINDQDGSSLVAERWLNDGLAYKDIYTPTGEKMSDALRLAYESLYRAHQIKALAEYADGERCSVASFDVAAWQSLELHAGAAINYNDGLMTVTGSGRVSQIVYDLQPDSGTALARMTIAPQVVITDPLADPDRIRVRHYAGYDSGDAPFLPDRTPQPDITIQNWIGRLGTMSGAGAYEPVIPEDAKGMRVRVGRLSTFSTKGEFQSFLVDSFEYADKEGVVESRQETQTFTPVIDRPVVTFL